MRPTIIPEQLIPEGCRRITVAAPSGDLLDPDVAPVEALVSPLGLHTTMSVRCMLEDDDLVELAKGGHVWLTFAGRLPVFAVRVGP